MGQCVWRAEGMQARARRNKHSVRTEVVDEHKACFAALLMGTPLSHPSSASVGLPPCCAAWVQIADFKPLPLALAK